MYASIRHYQIKPGTLAEITRQAEEGFLPIISKAPGLIAYYIVPENKGAGSTSSSFTTISIFQSQAQAEASVRLAAEWVKQNLAALVEGPPIVTSGEVTLHAVT